MNTLYPIFLKTEQLEVLIVGGGYVALEKLQFHARELRRLCQPSPFLCLLLDQRRQVPPFVPRILNNLENDFKCDTVTNRSVTVSRVIMFLAQV